MSTATDTATAIPAVLAGHALRSLRESGYTLPAALGEVIDNSVEADANEINIWLEETNGRGKRAHIGRIAVADDGTGMGADDEGRDILQHYLQLGFSTRYMRTDTIGKFGVGAKLGALNFARQIDVWSRTDADTPWRHARFDLDAAVEQEREHHLVTIAPPDLEPVPDDLEFLLPESGGTLVVWSKVDRLEEGRWAANAEALRVEVEKELSRIFRYFLNGGIQITVNDRPLLAHDPLFLMKETWADEQLKTDQRRLAQEEARKAKARGEKPSRAKVGDHYEATVYGRTKLKIAGAEAELTVSLYPPEVTRKRGQGGDRLAKTLRVVENQGRISFVRLNREISYTTVPRAFPTAVLDPDRFIGVEVRFAPELDDYFGVRNVKRGVEPHGDLRVQLREHLAKFIREARAERDRRWQEVSRKAQEHVGEHGGIAKAVAEANKTLPKSRAQTAASEAEHEQALEDLATDVGKVEGPDREAYIDEVRELPIAIESVDVSGQGFIDVQHVAGKVIVRLNTRHRFYRELWQPIRDISQQDPGTVSGVEAVEVARRSREALTLLLMAYAKAESMDQDPRERYGTLRDFWGMFLDSLLGKVKDVN